MSASCGCYASANAVWQFNFKNNPLYGNRSKISFRSSTLIRFCVRQDYPYSHLYHSHCVKNFVKVRYYKLALKAPSSPAEIRFPVNFQSIVHFRLRLTCRHPFCSTSVSPRFQKKKPPNNFSLIPEIAYRNIKTKNCDILPWDLEISSYGKDTWHMTL